MAALEVAGSWAVTTCGVSSVPCPDSGCPVSPSISRGLARVREGNRKPAVWMWKQVHLVEDLAEPLLPGGEAGPGASRGDLGAFKSWFSGWTETVKAPEPQFPFLCRAAAQLGGDAG